MLIKNIGNKLQKLGGENLKYTALAFVVAFASVGYIVLNNSHAAVNADVNGNGVVDLIDLSTLLSNYGRTGITSNNLSVGDINGDGTVGLIDLSTLLSNWGASSTTTPTPFPSRIHVSNGHLLDENNYDIGTLKGFNVHVASTVSGDNFVWSQTDYDAMHSAGSKLVRHVIMWDVFEQSPGVFDQTALTSLDTAIARAGQAGMYTVLSVPHLNVNRVPAWAKTASNEWDDYVAHGQALTQMLANRYKDNKFVIGMYPNEPTVSDLGHLMTGYQTTVGWYSGIATSWPIWVNPTAWGNGTPYPQTGTQINPTTINALDVNHHGVVIEWHDYLNLAGSYSPDGYQPNGAIAPIQQSANFTAQYHGWQCGGVPCNYSYSNTDQTRTDFVSHIAPLAQLRNSNSNFALAVGEFGMDNQSNESAYIIDKDSVYKAAGAAVELWWVYDTNSSNDPFAARPGGTWLPGISSWLLGSQIYWGSYLDVSSPTNDYGSTDVHGQAWQSGPWSATYPGNTWDTFEAHAGGKTMSLMHWGTYPPWLFAYKYPSTGKVFDSNPATLAWNRGAIPVIDIDTTRDLAGGYTIPDQTNATGTATINGKTYDQWWTQWFTEVKNWGHPIFFVPDVEMNGQWEPYSPFKNGNTAASFVAMWRHLHDLADAAGATNVTWVWCPNIDNNPSYTGVYRPLSDLFPGNNYVDWVGMDGFSFSGTTFDNVFSSTLSTINTITGSSKPFMLSQTGATPDANGGKPAWLTDAFNQLQTSKYAQIKAIVWFNWWHADGGTHDVDIETPYNGTLPIPISSWSSNTNMPAAQAFAAGVAPTYFKPKLTTMPPFGKVPLP